MEAVGARLGRSSTRYGPTTVFTGPVRKWKKKWVPVLALTTANHTSQGNGNITSHLLLYKWTSGDNNSSKDDDSAASPEEAPRKKFRYVPITVLEEQKEEDAEKVDDEAKPTETEQSPGETSKGDGADEKPDINDVPMEESQASELEKAPQDLNETSLDLSLGLKGHDGDQDSDPRQADHSKEELSGVAGTQMNLCY